MKEIQKIKAMYRVNLPVYGRQLFFLSIQDKKESWAGVNDVATYTQWIVETLNGIFSVQVLYCRGDYVMGGEKTKTDEVGMIQPALESLGLYPKVLNDSLRFEAGKKV